jgi:hypothetical protein
MKGTSVEKEVGMDVYVCVCVCVCVNTCSNPDPSIPVGDDPGPPISYSSTTLVFHFATMFYSFREFHVHKCW